MGKKPSALKIAPSLVKVQVYQQQEKVNLEISKKEIISAIQFTLSQLNQKKQFSFTVIFIDDEKIKDLNKRFRQVDRFTDVLVFPYSSREAEIYISAERIFAQAREYRQTVKEETMRLLIHGVLHSLGWRDESQKEFKKMWAMQEKILSSFTKVKLDFTD